MTIQPTTTAQRIDKYLRAALDFAPAQIGAAPTSLSMAVNVIAAELDAKDRRIAALEQIAADVDSVSKAEFQRLDAKVKELQLISDVWHARLTWARTNAWASVLGSAFMRDEAKERKAEYEALLAKLPQESRP